MSIYVNKSRPYLSENAHFIQLCKSWIKEHKKTQKELATELRCHSSTLCKILKGDNRVTQSIAESAKKLFDKSTEYLIGESEDPYHEATQTIESLERIFGIVTLQSINRKDISGKKETAIQFSPSNELYHFLVKYYSAIKKYGTKKLAENALENIKREYTLSTSKSDSLRCVLLPRLWCSDMLEEDTKKKK